MDMKSAKKKHFIFHNSKKIAFNIVKGYFFNYFFGLADK